MGYNRLQWWVQVSTSSPTEVGSRVLWYFECPIGLSQKGICAHLIKEVWRNFNGPSKNKGSVELRSEF